MGNGDQLQAMTTPPPAHSMRGRRATHWSTLVMAWLVALLCHEGALAQPAPDAQQTDTATADSSHADPEPESPTVGSPREAVESFLLACRAGRYDDAARFLSLPSEGDARGAELAKRLKAVLDHFLWVDLSAISNRTTGTLDYDLPRNLEEIGSVALRGRGQ